MHGRNLLETLEQPYLLLMQAPRDNTLPILGEDGDDQVDYSTLLFRKLSLLVISNF